MTANTTNKVFDLNVLFTKADVISGIQRVAIIANTTNKVVNLNVLFTRADVITDIQLVAIAANITRCICTCHSTHIARFQPLMTQL